MEPQTESIEKLNIFSEPIQFALNTIKEKYDSVLPYHNSSHTENVVKRAFQIGQALGLTERQSELLQIAASFHDLVSDFDIKEFDGIKKRQMRREENEIASAQEAERWMRQKGGYSEEEIDLVKKAILTTIPAWDEKNKTVYQPDLNTESDPVIRVLCLADIGGAGMKADDCLKDSSKLFLEEYVDFYDFLLGKKQLSEKDKKIYLNKFKEFIQSQIDFVNGRKNRFESEISGIDDDKKEKLKELFSDFDSSCALIGNLISQTKQCDFNSLVKIFKEKIS